MSSFNLTPEQRQAIETRGQNLLVAAGAGSGKTTVLVERVIRFLAAGGQAQRLLALTFTNAAATDMRVRIDQALADLAAAEPHNEHLRCQLALLPQAGISTIHSFCLELLRQNGYRLQLPPGFRVAGELEGRLLQSEVMDDLLEAEYSRPDSLLPALADAYGGGRDDSGLAGLLHSLYSFSLSRPNPTEWLESCAAAFAPRPDLDAYPFAPFLCQALDFGLAAANSRLRQAAALSGLPRRWLELLARESDDVNQAGSSGGLEARLARLGEISFGRLTTTGKAEGERNAAGELLYLYDADNRDRCKRLREQAKKEIYRLQSKYCGRDAAQYRAELDALWPLMNELSRLTRLYGQLLATEKRRRGLVDFSDMEHLALELLADPEVRRELAGRYDEVLIDEYQDINAVQEAILSALGAAVTFAVGDVKQSIYRFRLAEPGLFLDKYRRYGAGEGGRRIDLNQNYRSDQLVLRGVNFLFQQLMTREVAELDYDRQAALYPGRDSLGQPPELALIDLGTRGDQAPPGLLAEGRWIARRILELRQEGYALSEMAVLLRAGKSRESLIVAALAEAGIAAAADHEDDYTESAEIRLALALLQLIDNPHQDIPLAAVLRSPLFGFSADDLVSIRLASREGDLWQALTAAAQTEDALGQRALVFCRQLQAWRRLAGEERISDLLAAIYRDSGFSRLLSAMSNGRRRRANLRLLQERARQYEASGYAGLFRFIRLIEDGQALQVRQGAASLGAGEDAVRVMTIHKSKGLEFPVVFVAGLSANFNAMDERQDVIWERGLGLGARLADRQQRCKYPTLSHHAVAEKLRQQSLAEEMRVLYVALTRARQRLILTASLKNTGSALAQWGDAAAAAGSQPTLALCDLAAARQPLDWLIPALLRHEDAAALRQAAALPLPRLASDSRWQVSLVAAAELQATDAAAAPPQPGAAVEVPADLQQAVESALSYRYPQARLCPYPAKWTVSALNRLGLTAEELDSRLLLPEEEAEASGSQPLGTLTGAERGIACHRFLELADLSHTSRPELEQQLRQMQRQQLISPQLAAAIDLPRLAAFFRRGLGQRLSQAKRVRREAAFTLLLPLAESEDSILLQGVLDAAFWQEDGWVLLDYKTGGQGRSDSQLAALYGEQLSYYCRAVEQLWQAPLREAYLVMLDLERDIRLG